MNFSFRKIYFFLMILAVCMLTTTSYAAEWVKAPELAMDKYYDVVREAAPGLPGWTVYRPDDQALIWSTREKLPILIWSNGACTETNDGAFYFLEQIAAHGFVVVAFGKPDVHVGGNGIAVAARMESAIDWATSPPWRGGPWYFNQVDVKKIATSGFSCGGVDAEYTAVTDRRVKTSVIVSSGFYPDLLPGQTPSMSGPLAHSRDLLPNLYGPIIFLPGSPPGVGTTSDIAYPNAIANYNLISTVPTVLAYHANTAHGGYLGTAPTSLQLQAVQTVVDWLDGILNKNQQALDWVIGPDGLSTLQDWTVQSKGF
ncbi:MAG TPA: hypothetical protein VMT62_04300 [Syntrophorhabdaceae bacterium]|nr:hypothetical protein [Syntrophorhabdaceae bacterium]